jgi:hypothetical protein
MLHKNGVGRVEFNREWRQLRFRFGHCQVGISAEDSEFPHLHSFLVKEGLLSSERPPVNYEDLLRRSDEGATACSALPISDGIEYGQQAPSDLETSDGLSSRSCEVGESESLHPLPSQTSPLEELGYSERVSFSCIGAPLPSDLPQGYEILEVKNTHGSYKQGAGRYVVTVCKRIDSSAEHLSHGSAAKKSTIQQQAPPALAIDALCVPSMGTL